MKENSDKIGIYFKELITTLCKISENFQYAGKLDRLIYLFDSINVILELNEIRNEDKARFLIEYVAIKQKMKFIKDFDFHEEIELLNKAITLAKSSNAKFLVADAIDLLGTCIYSRGILEGDFEEAIEYFNEALALREKSNDKQGIAKSYFNLGLFYENKKSSTEKDKQIAFKYYQDGLKISIEENLKLEQAYFYRHIAYIYQFHKNDLDKALEYHKKTANIREEIGFKFALQFAYFAIALVYFFKEDDENSLKWFEKAYKAAIEMKRVEQLRILILRRGDEIKNEIESETALRYYLQIQSVAKEVNDMNAVTEIEQKIKIL